MIEHLESPADRTRPATRERRLRLDADALALLTLPSGTPLAQLQLRQVQTELRGNRLRQRDDQQQAVAKDVMSRPRSSDLAREDARSEPRATDSTREPRGARSNANETVDSGASSFRRELAEARRETPQASATPATPAPSSANGNAGRAAAAPNGATVTATEPRTTVATTPRTAAAATVAVPLVTGAQNGNAAHPSTAALQTAVRAVATAHSAGAAATAATARVGSESAAARPANAVAPGSATARTERAATVKTAATDTQEAQLAERSDDANLERILRVVRMQLARDRSSATIRLDPDELGQLRMKLDLAGAAVTLNVEAEHDAARRLLVDQVDALRRGLEAAGLVLERIEIRVVDQSTPGDLSGNANSSGSWQAGPNDQGPSHREDPPPVAIASGAAPETQETERPSSMPAAESLVNFLA